MQIDKDKEKITEVLEKNGVILGYFFGSCARDTAGPLSDIDVAIVFLLSVFDAQKKEKDTKHALQDAFNKEKVDIINLGKNENVALGYKILFEGICLVNKDLRLKRTLESKYLRDFEDTKHLRYAQFNI